MWIKTDIFVDNVEKLNHVYELAILHVDKIVEKIFWRLQHNFLSLKKAAIPEKAGSAAVK